MTLLKNKAMLKLLWKFIEEREEIRKRRARGQKWPWTKDEHLRDYHWPNVHRRDDDGTKFIQAHLEGQSDHEVLFRVYAYRGLNRQETFERFGLPTLATWRNWLPKVQKAHAEGMTVGSDKHMTFISRYAAAMPQVANDRNLSSLVFGAADGVSAVELLNRFITGVGPFLGTQMVGDIAQTEQASFGKDTIVPVSGGSRIGLGYLTGTITPAMLEAEKVVAKKMAEKRKAVLVAQGFKSNRTSFHSKGFFMKVRTLGWWENEREAFVELHDSKQARRFSMSFIDLEHCLCELSRYYGVKTGQKTGHKRPPPHEYSIACRHGISWADDCSDCGRLV